MPYLQTIMLCGQSDQFVSPGDVFSRFGITEKSRRQKYRELAPAFFQARSPAFG